jgi:hypothetical protein
VTPEPSDRFEFSPELDRDLLALARVLDIRAESDPAEPEGVPAFERERRRLEDLIRRQLPKGPNRCRE